MADTVATVTARAARLIPNARSARLATHGAYCCTPVVTVPERFRAGQAEHTAAYMAGKGRGSVDGAVAFYVTSYGVPVAWVTYDGTTHYASASDLLDAMPAGTYPAEHRTMVRHRDAIRAVWPAAFHTGAAGGGPWSGRGDRELRMPTATGDAPRSRLAA